MAPRRSFRSRRPQRTNRRPATTWGSRIRSGIRTAGRYAGYAYTGYKAYQRLKKHVPWLPIRPIEGGFKAPNGSTVARSVLPHDSRGVMSLGAGSGHTVKIGDRARSILPARLKTKMIYSEMFHAVSSPPANFVQAFNANSLWKPNNTSAGHRPLGFDEIFALYRMYIVTGCKVVIEGTNASGVGAQLNIGALASGVSLPANLAAYNESPFFNTHVVSNSHRWKVSYFVDPAKTLGQTLQQYMDDEDNWGTGASSPTNLILAHLVINNIDLTQYIGNFSVTLIFYCTMFDPLQLVQS